MDINDKECIGYSETTIDEQCIYCGERSVIWPRCLCMSCPDRYCKSCKMGWYSDLVDDEDED